MEILFITRKWPPAVGGMEVYSTELVTELRRSGHQIDLRALPGRGDGRAPGGLALIGFGLRTGWSVFWTPGGWDAIHGADFAVWPLAWLAWLRRPVPVVLSAHGTDVAFAQRAGWRARAYRLYLRLGARLLKRARVAANSNATADLARRAGFGRVAVIALACRPVAPQGPVPNGPYLLFAGRLVRRKGLGWFVSAVLPRLPDDLRLVVAGPRWDRSEDIALANPQVDYLGTVASGRLAALAGGARAVVIPNLPSEPGIVEGFGLVAAEAAVAGGLVLAARSGGLSSAVIDGETGRLLAPGDADAWVAAIAEITAWPRARRASFVSHAQQVAQDQFRWDRVARETAALYQPRPP